MAHRDARWMPHSLRFCPRHRPADVYRPNTPPTITHSDRITVGRRKECPALARMRRNGTMQWALGEHSARAPSPGKALFPHEQSAPDWPLLVKSRQVISTRELKSRQPPPGSVKICQGPAVTSGPMGLLVWHGAATASARDEKGRGESGPATHDPPTKGRVTEIRKRAQRTRECDGAIKAATACIAHKFWS